MNEQVLDTYMEEIEAWEISRHEEELLNDEEYNYWGCYL
jgi:hypothetical protein